MSINFDFRELELPQYTPPTASPPEKLSNERFIGGLILIFGLALVLFFCISTDSSTIIPHNRNVAATLTAVAPHK